MFGVTHLVGFGSGGDGEPIPGFKAWYRGDGYVSGTWTDRSANGYNLTEATNPPAVVASDTNFNGHPVVDFDGTNDVLSGTTFSNLIAAGAFTIFGVIRADNFGSADTGKGTERGVYGGTGGFTGLALGLTQFEGHNYDGTDDYTNNPTISLSTVYGFDYRHDTGNILLLVSGKAEASAASGNTTDLTNALKVGVGFSEFWDGRIAELIFYNTVLSTAERQVVRDYLAKRYLITW